MLDPATAARWLYGLLTLGIALAVLLPRPGGPRRGKAWWVFLAAGVATALVPLARRLDHSNLAHYYLGAKYRVPYFEFYRVMTAALERPQAGYRDLRRPDRLVRQDPRERRYYYLDLLRRGGVDFPADASDEELASLGESSGRVRAEAEDILDRHPGREKADALRGDLRRLRLDTDDNGFNGSPAYVLFRQADPSLHIRFGPAACLINLLWQFGAVLLAVQLLGLALDWTGEARWFAAAVVFCSWDFGGWALNGLSFGGWLLPSALALYGLQRRRPALAGLGLAWAGLTKLFPFVLIVPAGALWLRAVLARVSGSRSAGVSARVRDGLVLLGWTLLFTVLLAAAGAGTGMPWRDFLQKIHGQFELTRFIANTVSPGQILLALGVAHSSILVIPSALLAWAAFELLFIPSMDEAGRRLARTSLLLLCLLVWALDNWLNYYAVVSLLLLPGLLANRPKTAGAFLLAFAAVTFLPDYHQCYLQPGLRLLGILRALPHLALPAWVLGLELQAIHSGTAAAGETWRRHVSRFAPAVYAAGLALLAAAVCGGICRAHAARSAAAVALALQTAGRLPEAEAPYRRATRLAPDRTAFRLALADTLYDLRRYREAAELYGQVVAREPEQGRAWVNLALVALRQGHRGGALDLFQRGVDAAPHDELVRYNYAVALRANGRAREAAEQAQWACLLRPSFAEAARLVEELRQEGAP